MVRVALLVGIALALVMQVFASGVVAVNGRVSQKHILRDKLTPSPEIINSTDSAFHDGLNYDRFLGPDSKVDPTLQTAILKLKELQTAPSCNKMASSALIYTCDTTKDDNEAQESVEDPLRKEKILFAARLAVCELSDSDSQSLIPGECASFIITESNTKKRGWFGYVSAKDYKKLMPRYPEYDQATRQDLERCVLALQSSSPTAISYSNAKQTAHQWCSIVRADIEKDKLLQTYRAGYEGNLQLNDIIRSHTETLYQQMEAARFLNIRLRKMSKDTMDTFEAFREVAQQTVHNLVKDMGVQLQAQLDQSKAAHEAHDASLKAEVDKLVSEIKNITKQHSTDLALARSDDAKEFSGRLSYVVELIETRMTQLSSNADNTSREVAVRGSETLEIFQLVKRELVGVLQDANKVDEVVRNIEGKVQHVESQLLVISDRISAISAAFTWVFDCILATAWYCRYYIGAGAFILFLCLGGWRILIRAVANILKLFWIALNSFKELAKHVLFAASSSLSTAMSAAQQLVGVKCALSLIAGVFFVFCYSLAVETPTAYYQRWENGDLYLFEGPHIAIIVVAVIGFLCAISIPATAIRESGFLQSGEHESYDDKECAV